jgi:hypothetical protein
MKKLGLLSSLIILLSVISCTKDQYDFPTPTSGNLKEIKVSSNFDWSTSKPVDINITGLPTIVPVYSTLSIRDEEGSTLYQGMHEMGKNTVIKVNVPSVTDKLHMQYGTVTYVLQIENGKAEFSFIPVIEE